MHHPALFADDLALMQYARDHALVVAWEGTGQWRKWAERLPIMQFRRSVTAACTLRGLTRALLVPQRIVKADQETTAQAGRARAAERRNRTRRPPAARKNDIS